MGSIEDLWERADGSPKARYGQGKRFKAVPWLAGFDGGVGRRGQSETFDHFRDAEFYIARVERGDDTAVVASGAQPSRARRRKTFAEYVVEVAATLGASHNTRRNYASMGRALAAEWPTHALDEISPDMIDAYFARLLSENYSSSTRAKRRTVLTTTYRRAMRAGYIKVDPTAEVRPINQTTKRKQRPVTAEEFGWIVADTPAWLRPAMYLAYYSGLRSGELCGLQWAAVDLDQAVVYVGPVMLDDGSLKPVPKNERPAEVPMTPETVELLRAYRERFTGGPADLVFREPRVGGRQPVTPQRYRRLFHQCCRMASLPAPLPRPHDMRHGCAKRLKDRGAPPHIVQAVLRHENIGSTMVYFPRVEIDEMRAVMA